MASPVIADPLHRMKYMERHGSGLRKIVRETEKPPGYTAAYNPEIFSTATDFRVILKNVNYQLSQKNLVNDQVSEQDKSPDIPHTVLNLCIHLIAHGSEGAQITHAHSIMGTANDKSYDATHDTTHDIVVTVLTGLNGKKALASQIPCAVFLRNQQLRAACATAAFQHFCQLANVQNIIPQAQMIR